MATERSLAKVEPTEIALSPAYRKLLADCQDICESIRRSTIEHFWRLGERIHREIPEDREDHYREAIILSLERDLQIDRTTLWRAIQVYQTYDLPDILDTVSRMLTWRKIRMLLPLPDAQRKQIEERIRSGELRTDNDVRLAIYELKRALGELPPSPLGDAEPDLLGVKGIKADKLRVLWWRATPIGRALVIRALIPEMDLDRAERKEALGAIQAIRQQLDEYEKRLGVATERKR